MGVFALVGLWLALVAIAVVVSTIKTAWDSFWGKDEPTDGFNGYGDKRTFFQCHQWGPHRAFCNAWRRADGALTIQKVRRTRNLDDYLLLLGCSQADFAKHIEGQFSSGMDWENHGEWHIDHRLPCS
jgi:hypothetical protein